jgi:uncharacterized protein YbjT (DUF2867 family)
MPRKNICVLGGTGFVGRRIAAHLIGAGHRVLIPTRRYARNRDLTVLPTARLIEGDIHDMTFLRRTCADMDAVINLVGILNERRRSNFASVHAALPSKVADACQQSGVKRLLHMSALNASHEAPSLYLRTKAQGEEAVHRAANSDFHVTSFRPAVIFGKRDSFTNRFASLLRSTPGIFPLACADARLQPVHVEDVAQAFVRSLDEHKTFGQRYALCGPNVYTLRQIVEYVASLSGLRRRVIALNDTWSSLQAALLELFPGKPFSLDNYRSLKVDGVCPAGFPSLFGIAPATLESIAPTYLSAR